LFHWRTRMPVYKYLTWERTSFAEVGMSMEFGRNRSETLWRPPPLRQLPTSSPSLNASPSVPSPRRSRGNAEEAIEADHETIAGRRKTFLRVKLLINRTVITPDALPRLSSSRCCTTRAKLR